MPLPIAGGGRPTRPPTHQPLDLQRLLPLATELQEAVEAADIDQLDADRMSELAADIGAAESHLYAAAALLTEIPFDQSAPVRFEVCAGGCQGWGALAVIDRLIMLRGQRGAGFGIVARRCLDKCDRAAVVLVHTPEGSAGISEATVAAIDEAVELACPM